MMANERVAISFILNLLAYNSALHVLESSGHYSSEIAKMPRLLSHPGQCFPSCCGEEHLIPVILAASLLDHWREDFH